MPSFLPPTAVVLLVVFTSFSGYLFPALAQDLEEPVERPRDWSAEVEQLPDRYREWVLSVAGLITEAELRYFLDLEEDYRRDAFIEAFWGPRDPDPVTPRNELRERWQSYRASAGAFPYGDPRFLLFLLNGPPGRWTLPDGRPVARCFSRFKELEIWFYDGSERVSRRFVVVFYRPGVNAPYEVYRPGGNLRAINRTSGLPTQDIRLLCADELLRYALREITAIPNYDRLLEEVLTPPLPSAEWLATLEARGTALPEGAETFELETELRFPSRKQSRTAVQVLLEIPREEAPGRVFGEETFHNFLVVGEVIRDGRLFESFRYRFEGPTPEGVATIPLGFTRYLRQGEVELRLLVEDVLSGRFAQVTRTIDVPSPVDLPPVEVERVEVPTGPALELLAPPGDIHTGLVRFTARAFGEFERVTFFLDDQPVLGKRSPPYSVELDLGEVPEPHRVRVVGLADGKEVATDQIWLNQGAQRFRVHIIEPRPGGIYPGSLTARVDVETPDGQPPERLELYVNDRLATELEEPPYSHTLKLPGTRTAVVRAVAYLADGTSAEDAVVVNGSAFMEEIEVQLVELGVLVTDETGEPIRGLTEEQFRILEDGVEQTIERFEEATDAAIRAALLVDRSASMAPHLDTVAEAAGTFARGVMETSEDRVAVLSFADEATIDSGFTSNPAQVERTLSGLVPFGSTALYDSLVQGLNAFEGTEGLNALVLFSDGQDDASRLSFEQTVETARRSGVILYSIGLQESFPDRATRRLLEDLARESGGEAFFLQDLDELPAIYDRIRTELRSRYLLAYQPSETGDEERFRTIEVEVDVPGARVRTRSGYYP